MCQQVIEHYRGCDCLYHKHAVDPCPAFGHAGHQVSMIVVHVEFTCPDHWSSSSPTEVPNATISSNTSQQPEKLHDQSFIATNAPMISAIDLEPIREFARTLQSIDRPPNEIPGILNGPSKDSLATFLPDLQSNNLATGPKSRHSRNVKAAKNDSSLLDSASADTTSQEVPLFERDLSDFSYNFQSETVDTDEDDYIIRDKRVDDRLVSNDEIDIRERQRNLPEEDPLSSIGGRGGRQTESYPSDGDDSVVDIRPDERNRGNRELTQDQMKNLAAGVIAGIGAAELIRRRREKELHNSPSGIVEDIQNREDHGFTSDEHVRAMARRKKDYIPEIVDMSCSHPDCDKIFHRKSDLSKHEKIHSRPFRCPFTTCKYHDLGLPTEKEKQRHINERHDPNPKIYHCNFCEFHTKRESNCKQHMEKKHNWKYTREKRKEKQINLDYVSAQTSARTATDRSLEYSHQTLDGDGNCQLDHWLSNLDSLSHAVDPGKQELRHDGLMLKGRSFTLPQWSRNNNTTRTQWSMLKTGIMDGDHEGSTLVHSQAPSVLSFPTIASTNTAYSISDLISATRELIQMFTGDEFFRPLYLEALNDPQFDGERMTRNFGRLLSAYGIGLKEEAEDSLQHTAARFVQNRAKHVARSIQQAFERELGKSTEKVPTNARYPAGAHDDGEESDEDQARYLEDSVGTLLPIIDFLRGGGAFQKLKEDFQTFIRPHVQFRLQFQNQEQAISTSDELPMDPTSPNASGSTEVQSRLKTLGSALPVQWPSTLFQLRVRLGEVSLLEPLVREKHRRIRWTCKCGTKLYDDYRELKTGTLATLQERLIGQNATHPVKHCTDQYTTPSSYCNALKTMFTHPQSMFSGKSKQCGKSLCLPQHNLQTTASSASSLASTLVNDAPYLLACIRAEHQSNKLHHNPVGGLQFDRDLFVALRTNYMRQRGRLFNLFSLQKLVGVHFVKFGVLQTEYVDIRRHFSSCQSACMCLPPKEKIDQAEYECTPVPPEVSPPIGPNLITHLMSNPCCVPAKQTWMLKQMPKKLKGRLEGKLDENVTGWGLHFDEGLHWAKIWTILFAVFVLGSLCFAILWSVYRFDVQGAFGVASWWISLCTVLLGILATKDMSS